MSDPPTIRPYTSYNLFFQLEREYILQTLLGFQPTIASKDIFNPADKTYPVEAPPLPSRYENLILPYDWHIPGKTRRRKRSHRKSHGKIGFHELNEQISKAWSKTDDEIRNFCACLSNIESMKCKKVKRKTTDKKKVTRKRIKGKTAVTKSIKTEPKDDDCNGLFPSFDFAIDSLCSDISTSISSPKIRRMVSRDSVGVKHEDLSRARSHSESFTEVDMEDDEIIDIWKTTPTEDDEIPSVLSSTCQMCVDIVNHTAAITAQEEDEEKQDNTRKSFIDAEYEKFQAIGKQFSRKLRLPSKPNRKSFVACQA